MRGHWFGFSVRTIHTTNDLPQYHPSHHKSHDILVAQLGTAQAVLERTCTDHNTTSIYVRLRGIERFRVRDYLTSAYINFGVDQVESPKGTQAG